MGNLIKMDLYKVRKIKISYIALIVMVLYSALDNILLPWIVEVLDLSDIIKDVKFSDMLINPKMYIMMFFAMTAFSYMDIAHGYIKNMAGQLRNKGNTVLSKFVAIGVYSLIFIILAGLVNAFTKMFYYNVSFDAENIPLAVCTLLIKWMLAMALCSIFLFFTNGVKSNVVGYIAVVILSAGVTRSIYALIDMGIRKLDISDDLSVYDYAPDILIDSVDVIHGKLILNGILSAVIVTALFLTLAVSMFNKKDVK